MTLTATLPTAFPITPADGLFLVLAFLPPLPPERPVWPVRPEVNWWIVGSAAAFLLAVTLMPLSLALAEHWALGRFRTTCLERGGRFTHLPTDDRHPYRCDLGAGPGAAP